MSKINSILISLWVPLLCLWGCGSKDESGSDTRAGVFSLIPEYAGTMHSSLHSASVEEGKSVNVGFKTGGQIKRLTADEGSYVRKGQVIGYLDDTDYALSLKQVETQYDQLAAEMKRIEEMYRHHNISDNDYEKAKAGIDQLKIQLNLAKNNLSYARLEAPVSGYVVEKYMEAGEMTGAGTPVYRIVDNSRVEANVAVPPEVYSRRERIAKCIGHTAATGDKEIPLEILGFIPDGDNNSLFKLRLGIPDAGDSILPGMNMSVEIFYHGEVEESRKLIPSRALFEREGRTYVWRINPADSTLEAQAVRIIGIPDGEHSVVEGLPEGTEIVAAGVHHLSDKQKVRVLGKVEDIKQIAR